MLAPLGLLGREMLSAPTVTTVTRLSNFPARGRIGCPSKLTQDKAKAQESSAAGNFAS